MGEEKLPLLIADRHISAGQIRIETNHGRQPCGLFDRTVFLKWSACIVRWRKTTRHNNILLCFDRFYDTIS